MTIALFVKLLIAIIPATALFIGWLLGDKRKIAGIKIEIERKKKELRNALASNDSVRISQLELDIKLLHKKLSDYTNSK